MATQPPAGKPRRYKVRSVVDVDWDIIKRVTGRVKEKPVAVPEIENRKVMIVDADDSIFRIYESFDLQETFANAEVGDHVDIEYLETISLKGGKTMKRFNARLWTE